MLERIHYIDYAADGGAAQKAAQEKLPGQLPALDAAGGGAPPAGAWLSPFPGLASFDGDRAWAFCGRRAETNDLAELMRFPATAAAEELVVVVGPPGCGKSSPVRAGVLPRLLGEGGRWALPPVVPGGHPRGALAGAFAGAGVQRGLAWTREEVSERLARAAPPGDAGAADGGGEPPRAAAAGGRPPREVHPKDTGTGSWWCWTSPGGC